MLRQVETACPKCGSHYRRDDVCNVCGTLAPAQERVERYTLAGRAPTGKVWDSKLHRYIKRSDMKR